MSVCALALYWALCDATTSEKEPHARPHKIICRSAEAPTGPVYIPISQLDLPQLYSVAQLIFVARLSPVSQLAWSHSQHHHLLFKMLLSMLPGCLYQVQEQRSSVSVPFWWRLQLLCIPGKKPRQAIYWIDGLEGYQVCANCSWQCCQSQRSDELL